MLGGLNVYGAVTSRRRDFGRRRALGASRSAIVALVVTQTAIVAALGAAVGSFLIQRWTGSGPDPSFALAVATLVILAALVSAVPPALVAAYRDPVRILRVP